MGAPAPALVLERVSKRFSRGARPVEAVREVSLELAGGEVVALLGENGAGKTTLLRMVAGLVRPSSGEIRLAGRALRGDVGAVQRGIGWCSSDERSFYPRLTALENARLFAALHGLGPRAAAARIGELAEAFGLVEALGKPFQACSTGQRQRLNLLRALLHEPSVLLLDEPARSLDAASRRALAGALRDYVSRPGRLVLVAGHDLEGFEDVCQRVVVLHQGRLVFAGRASEVFASGSSPGWEIVFRSGEARERALAQHAALSAGRRAEIAECGSDPPEWSRMLGPAAEVVRIERRAEPGLRQLLQRIHEVAPRPQAPAEATRTSAITPAPAIPRPPALRAALGLARRDRLVALSHRFQTGLKLGLLAAWILTLYFVSGLVDTSSPRVARHLAGDYFTYALLGVACLRISQVGLVQMAAALREEQLQGTLEPLLVTGQPPLLLLLGGLLWPLASDLLGLVVVFGAGALLLGADLSAANVPALLAAGLAIVVAMAVWGVLSSAFVIAFKRGDPVALLLNLVTIGLSGVFFPVEMIPEWLQPVSRVLPLTFGLEAVRAAALRGAGFASPEYLGAMGALAVLLALVAPLAWWAYRAAVEHARRAGSLHHS